MAEQAIIIVCRKSRQNVVRLQFSCQQFSLPNISAHAAKDHLTAQRTPKGRVRNQRAINSPSMTDPFPANSEIEIDRATLTSYLRAKWLLSWVAVVGLFGSVFGIVSIAEMFKRAPVSWSDVIATAAAVIGLGLAIPLFVAGLLYLAFSHRLAARFANELHVTIEGPFLRIRQHLIVATDRRLHFRSIVDYAVSQDPLMRYFQIEAIQMTTIGHGPASTISIPAVKNCLQTRDMLSEIDRLREHSV